MVEITAATVCRFNKTKNCKICNLESFMNIDWYDLLINEFKKEYFIVLKEKLHSSESITPKIEEVLNFTNYVTFSMIKVVIVGQDPYFTPNKACGIAFVSRDKTISYSLNTIFRGIKNDYSESVLNFESPFKWMAQGVLLINTHFTCEINKPNSHKNIGWFNFVKSIFLKLRSKKNLVYLLCGRESHKFTTVINSNENYVINTVHPGHFTAMKFVKEKLFIKINNYLEYKNIEKIHW